MSPTLPDVIWKSAFPGAKIVMSRSSEPLFWIVKLLVWDDTLLMLMLKFSAAFETFSWLKAPEDCANTARFDCANAGCAKKASRNNIEKPKPASGRVIDLKPI